MLCTHSVCLFNGQGLKMWANVTAMKRVGLLGKDYNQVNKELHTKYKRCNSFACKSVSMHVKWQMVQGGGSDWMINVCMWTSVL